MKQARIWGWAVLAIGLGAGTAVAQNISQLDTVIVTRVEHSMAGEYALSGAFVGAAAGALVRLGYEEYNRRDAMPYYGERKHANGRELVTTAALGVVGGAIIGAIIGSGERWTEEQRVPARVGFLPARGGGHVTFNVRM